MDQEKMKTQENSPEADVKQTEAKKEVPAPSNVESVNDYKDKYLRLLADFDNARKRMEREKHEFIKYANEGLIIEFLAILDDLERTLAAFQNQQDNRDAVKKGIEMVMAHIYEMLKRNGVKAIDTKGKMFDPHRHEILMQEETTEAKDGMVLEEFQKGYSLGDKIIRTAKVKVAKNKNV